MVWEPYTNDRPPSVASAMAMPSSATACMMADTMGMFNEMAGSSPRLNFTSGVFRLTSAGMHWAEE